MRKSTFAVLMLSLVPVLTLAQVKNRAPAPASTPTAASASASLIAEADRAFSYGEDAARDRQSLAVIERALAAEPNNYQVLWRAARSYYYVGDSANAKEKLRYYERGIEAGQRATSQQPDGAEGHFWLGANYGGYSEEKGIIQALQTVKKIRAEMEAVVRLNPSYEDGCAYLALGEIDRQMPGLLGGSTKRAITYLEQGLRIAPKNMDLKLALAEAYRDAGRRDEARKLLQEILQMPINPARAKQNRETQEKARKLLSK